MAVIRRLMALVVVVLTLAGCRVDAVVDVVVEPDGTGSVGVDAVFDAAASAQLDGLADNAFLADLGAAGWQVEPPVVGADGSTSFRAVAAFSDVAQLQRRLDDIAGPGVFTDVRITVDEAFAQREQRVSLVIDLSPGWSLLADEFVTESLDGEPFGAPIDTLTGGRSIDEIIDVGLRLTTSAGSDATPTTGTWSPRFDDVVPLTARVEASVENSTAILVRWIAWALASLLVLSVVLAGLGAWLDRQRVSRAPTVAPSGLRSRIPGVESKGGVGTQRSHDAVRLVVVEPLGVLVDTDEPLAYTVLASARSFGSTVRADGLLAAHDALVAGQAGPDFFWDRAGLGEQADEHSDALVAARQLRRDVASFLRELDRLDIGLAVITTDASDWSQATRRALSLGAADPWLVSSELGVTLPDAGVFERLRRLSQVSYRQCLYVDTDLDRLEAAQELGMRTALFSYAAASSSVVMGHAHVDDLDGVIKLLG